MKLLWELGNYFEEQCKAMIKVLKSDNLPVILWGNTTEDFWKPFFENNGIFVEAVCDKVAKRLGGGTTSILTPIETDCLYKDYNAVIVVPYPNRMRREIDSFEHKPKRIYYLDVAKLHTHPVLFKRPQKENIELEQEKILQVADMLEDDMSKEILEIMLNYWISGNHNLIERFVEMQDRQYLDVLRFSDHEVFVNVGAYDGRYSKRFAELIGDYKAIYNLECDPMNFTFLRKTLEGMKNCYFINKGAWDSYGKLAFQADGNAGSCLQENGDTEVEVDSIDHMFLDTDITFIKADVEGAEYKLLDGARETIAKYKPKLAICCYHQMEDLFEIPLKIKELNPEYKIKLRHYTDTLTETVCYAY